MAFRGNYFKIILDLLGIDIPFLPISMRRGWNHISPFFQGLKPLATYLAYLWHAFASIRFKISLKAE